MQPDMYFGRVRGKTSVLIGVSNVSHGQPRDSLDLFRRNHRRAPHLAGNANEILRDQGLARHARIGIAGQVRIEHRIADAIRDFIRMTLTHGFARQQEL